ncbi:MAG: DJ-1/PfpI family protein [Pirellulales bacterium]|nr:DJ-1/PfpI family protein [Pirellulales bacterium]
MSALRLPAVVVVVLALAASARAAEGDVPEATKPGDQQPVKTLGILLYKGFELLDVYGPAEVFGTQRNRLRVVMVAEQAGPVESTQGPKSVADYGFADCPKLDYLLVPGGFGTIPQLKNDVLLAWLRERAGEAEIMMSVCSGSALLAKAGLLDGKRATSNKQYFQMAVAQSDQVEWVKQARWVDAGDRVTSSGVSAGIDMALHVVARLYGEETAERVADGIEHTWNRDPDNDPFAKFAK